MRFEFATAARILFGPGVRGDLGAAVSAMGRRALVVTGRDASRADWLVEDLCRQGVACVTVPVEGEPTVERVRQGVEMAQTFGAEWVVAAGGGSAVDAGKAMAALCTNPGPVTDYLEVIGQGRPLKTAPIPFVAVPTTAGAGAEVTRNAVLTATDHRVKVSLRSPLMLARLAVVDPELSLGLPPALTASTGLDALTQLIEPYVSVRANPLTDGLCREGMVRVARSLRQAYAQGDDLAAREDMALASLLGGLALANAGLGAVHGFAAPLGGMFPAPHGAVCAALLPHVMEVNQRALQERQPGSAVLGRYEEIARLLTGHPTAQAADGVRWVRQICRDLQVPALRTYGVNEADYEVLVEKSARASSMKANPLPLTPTELRTILAQATQDAA